MAGILIQFIHQIVRVIQEIRKNGQLFVFQCCDNVYPYSNVNRYNLFQIKLIRKVNVDNTDSGFLWVVINTNDYRIMLSLCIYGTENRDIIIHIYAI